MDEEKVTITLSKKAHEKLWRYKLLKEAELGKRIKWEDYFLMLVGEKK